jgi:hypothetical protein
MKRSDIFCLKQAKIRYYYPCVCFTLKNALKPLVTFKGGTEVLIAWATIGTGLF